MTQLITSGDIMLARRDQASILQATGNEHAVKDIIKALDCPITDKGVAERILIELGKEIKFDRVSNNFLIKSEGQFKKANTQLIRDIVAQTIEGLPKEIRVINDAVKAGILSDAESHKKKLIHYVGQSNPSVIFGVVAILKSMLV